MLDKSCLCNSVGCPDHPETPVKMITCLCRGVIFPVDLTVCRLQTTLTAYETTNFQTPWRPYSSCYYYYYYYLDTVDPEPTMEQIRNAFTKNISFNIKTKQDVNPIKLKVCGNDRKKVIVVEVRMGRYILRHKYELKDIPNCSQSTFGTTPKITTRKSNSGWKFEPNVISILCPLVLFFSK